MTQVINEMKQPYEREIIEQLTFWQFKGKQFLSGPDIGLELLQNVTEKTKALLPMEDKQLPHKPKISDKIDPENMETDGNYSNIQSTSSFISGGKGSL
ncbi:hypothetical protein MAR_017873 [Mya arenaria]|uniref:Uncharacterized protein n=1 Tax=Mya arenaria TaxID=6604 RepID=A0ABY7EFQ2_MYAAR|nr:hypothetical protein MAR_017873 [Mya arenaria]